MTSKLELKLPKWIRSYLRLFESSFSQQCDWKTKNAYVFQFSDIYLIPLLVSMFSSADNNILYQGKQATRSIGRHNQSCYKIVHVPPYWGQSSNTKELLNMLDTTDAAITHAKVFHELFVVATPCTKPQTPLTTSHSIFMSWAAANRPEVEKWKK